MENYDVSLRPFLLNRSISLFIYPFEGCEKEIITYTFAVTSAVRMVSVDLHIGASIKSVQSSKQTLQGISLEEGVVLGYARYVYRELVIWKRQKRNVNAIDLNSNLKDSNKIICTLEKRKRKERNTRTFNAILIENIKILLLIIETIS